MKTGSKLLPSQRFGGRRNNASGNLRLNFWWRRSKSVKRRYRNRRNRYETGFLFVTDAVAEKARAFVAGKS
jgi:hypothetical protein